MKRTKRILAVLIVICLSFSQVVFAEESLEELMERYMSDLMEMDRVYKYDFVEKKIDSEAGESINDSEAIEAVVALGIMERLDNGKFGEEQFVTAGEFDRIILKLTVGGLLGDEEYLDDFVKQYVTQHEAAYQLVGTIGYGIYEKKFGGDNPRSLIANDIGLLKGIDFNGAKNVTRGELARMIYNTLQTDLVEQTVFGGKEEYSTVKGKNLLSEKFKAVLVEDIVTAQGGVNIYSNVQPKPVTIEIGRVPYYVDSITVPDLLGYRVVAIAVDDGRDYFSLINVTVSSKDETLNIDFANICSVNNTRLSYLDGAKERTVNIGAFSNILYNGKQATRTELVDILGKEGELRLCSSQKSGGFDIAIAIEDASYVIKGVSTMDEKVFFKYGMQYNGKDYVDISEVENITVRLDEAPADVSALKAGQVVSITGNELYGLTIVASTKTVEGSISALSSEGALIDEVLYKVSSTYEQAMALDNTKPAIAVGLSGIFYLNDKNAIVDYESDGKTYEYAYLTKIGYEGSGLNKKVLIRALTTGNEWKNFELADKLIFDGDAKTTSEEAYQKISVSQAEVLNSVIRYKTNKDEKITFLDTARTKGVAETINGDSEQYDSDAIKKCGSWTGTHNWTITSKLHRQLTRSEYILTNNTIVFSVPEDVSDEASYTASKKPTFKSETSGTLQLYNVDEFFVVPIVVETAGELTTIDNKMSLMVVQNILKAVDATGEEVYAIQGFNGAVAPYWVSETYFLTPELSEKAQTLKSGDIINFKATGQTIKNFEVKVLAENLDVEFVEEFGYSPSFSMGTVVATDPERQIVKISVNGREMTHYQHSLGLYDKATKRGYEITMDDVRVGDRIFSFGGYTYMRLLIIR